MQEQGARKRRNELRKKINYKYEYNNNDVVFFKVKELIILKKNIVSALVFSSVLCSFSSI